MPCQSPLARAAQRAHRCGRTEHLQVYRGQDEWTGDEGRRSSAGSGTKWNDRLQLFSVRLVDLIQIQIATVSRGQHGTFLVRALYPVADASRLNKSTSRLRVQPFGFQKSKCKSTEFRSRRLHRKRHAIYAWDPTGTPNKSTASRDAVANHRLQTLLCKAIDRAIAHVTMTACCHSAAQDDGRNIHRWQKNNTYGFAAL
ncbi:hypothetical protein RMSM_02250 [Rhodopirellula maiorica SM1]|uniref:Uncharacterized protein n=1 Tax=Rhodopirellula maiorica SM1 TaxID=1265738 RepID=M5RNQ9_9BACT|nr:hypothetical protein RMSM_02250 [Rhodopirellula maiorica SM1]